jgi:hypothetical protein
MIDAIEREDSAVVIRTTALERGEHGSHRAYQCGCRCPRCKSAQSRYSRRRWAVAAVVRGAAPHWKVDAGPTLARLDELRAAGWTLREISRVAEIPYPTLISIRQGHRRGTSQCWNTVAAAIAELERGPDPRR